MSTLLHEREQALVSLLQTALPGHRVRAASAPFTPGDSPGLVVEAPAAVVVLKEWQPPKGLLTWSVTLLEDARREPTLRRLGSAELMQPSGSHAALVALRESLLADASGAYDAAGGRALDPREGFARWEETIAESLPLLPMRAAIGAGVARAGTLAVAAGAGDEALTLGPPLRVGTARLVAWAAGEDALDVGPAEVSPAGVAALARPCARALGVGTPVFALAASFELPAAWRVSEAREFEESQPIARSLDGSARRVQIAAPLQRLTLDFPGRPSALDTAVQEFVRDAGSRAEWLFLPGDGRVLSLVVVSAARTYPGPMQSQWRLAVEASPAGTSARFEVAP